MVKLRKRKDVPYIENTNVRASSRRARKRTLFNKAHEMHLSTGDSVQLTWTRVDGKKRATYDSRTDAKSVDESNPEETSLVGDTEIKDVDVGVDVLESNGNEEEVTVVLTPESPTKAFRVYLEKEVQTEERPVLTHLCRVCQTDSPEDVAKGNIFLGCNGKMCSFWAHSHCIFLKTTPAKVRRLDFMCPKCLAKL